MSIKTSIKYFICYHTKLSSFFISVLTIVVVIIYQNIELLRLSIIITSQNIVFFNKTKFGNKNVKNVVLLYLFYYKKNCQQIFLCRQSDKKPRVSFYLKFNSSMVVPGGIEPPTQGFSVLCSTD